MSEIAAEIDEVDGDGKAAPKPAGRRKNAGMRTIVRVAPYLWPRGENGIRTRVVIAILALVAAKLVSVGTPFIYRAMVDGLAGDAPSGPWLLAIGVSGLTIAYGIARLTSVLFQELREFVFARVGQRALRKLALETIQHIHSLSLRYHIGRKTGALSRIIERGVKGVDFLLRFLLFNIVPMVLELALISAVLVILFDVWYLAIVTVTVSLYIWFTTIVTEWRVKIRQEMVEQDTNANQKAIDALLNFETVKYFGAEKREAERYDESMAAFEAASLRTVSSLSALNIGQSIIINTGLVLSLLLAANDVARGHLTVGGFVMVMAYLMQVMAPLDYLGYVYREIRQALVDMGEMFNLLEQKPEIIDAENAQPLKVNGGAISFENVVFGYDQNRSILKGVDLDINAGETVAIVGASGSGKSTIGRLLFRFYDVDSGALKIDGQDIRNVTQESLHNAIGVVPQDTVLFNDTVGYNIAYGRPGATQEDIERVARAAEVDDFIKRLPQGYDTMVGERGLKLSGGEKQRVGIARTMLKNAPILLLDEATSALDTETERHIQECLKAMSENRTVITIAHRLSTVVDADRIIVLHEGEIAEQGSHEALLELDGRYAQLWRRQLKEEEETLS